MSLPELPPLYHVWRARSSVAVTKESVEARERILMARIAELQEEADRRTLEVEATYHVQARLNARIAELEADAARYRWLAAKAQKDTAYDRYGNGAHWIIGFFAANGRHALDAAIDAARRKE